MRTFPLLFLALLAAGAAANAQTPKLKLVSVQKIWDRGEHNAFTDLIRFRDQWFCIFREGKGHAEGEGKLRVLTSPDGARWESAALIELPGRDLRDAKLSIAPGNRLMLVCGAADPVNRGPHSDFYSFVGFSNDGRAWGKLERIAGFDNRTWLWRVVWHQGTAYGAAYSWAQDSPQGTLRMWAVIARSRDGVHYKKISKDFPDLNEAALSFDEQGTLTAVFRSIDREQKATIAQTHAPFTEWTTKALIVDGWDNKFGGPAVLRLSDGRVIAGGRLYREKEQRTGVGLLDLNTGKMADLITLPSNGDSSYPGLVWHDGNLWVSYYSSHEGKTSIYLAKIEVAKR
jgi:hypothetical protein